MEANALNPTLVIAGTGICAISQLTNEVEKLIDTADAIFFLLTTHLLLGTSSIAGKMPSRCTPITKLAWIAEFLTITWPKKL
jgi:hypothetical protein